MGNFTTSCAASGGILNGSMVAANGDVSSYTSTSAGAGTVNNTGNSSTNLSFTVEFARSSRKYPITASPNSNGYGGGANASGIGGGEDPWTATIITADAEEDSDSDSEDGGDDELGDDSDGKSASD